MNSNDKYKKILSEHDFGNQIIFCIKRGNLLSQLKILKRLKI